MKFDAEILKWFRAMGLGYQARMNHVLTCWMLSAIAKKIAAGEAGMQGG